MSRLRITEIFYSLQGETRTVGIPTVFVRLTGCPLRCGYCDTSYAFQGGEWLDLSAIMEKVAGYGAHYVTVTGGEPLAQKACTELLVQLCDAGYEVSLETSGALDISQVDARVIKGSGEVEKWRSENIAFLNSQDQIKFVVCDQKDYEWAKKRMQEYDLARRCEVLMSPVHGSLEARMLADWILEDHLPVRMQVQLHKYLWGDEPGR